MSLVHSRRRSVVTTLAVVGVALGCGVCLWAGERTLKSSPQNYSEVPVIARSSTATLIDEDVSVSTSKGAAAARPAPSRTLVSTETTEGAEEEQPSSRFIPSQTIQRTTRTEQRHWLKGNVKCWNQSAKTMEALGLLVIPFDTYHNTLGASRTNLTQISETITGGGEKLLDWKVPAKVSEVAEVSVVILMIKFADGSMWQAPDVEKVDLF